MRWALRQPVIVAIWTAVVLVAGIASAATTTETRVVHVASADSSSGAAPAPSATPPAVEDKSPTTTEPALEHGTDASTASSATLAPPTSAPADIASVEPSPADPSPADQGDGAEGSTAPTNSTTTPPPTTTVTTTLTAPQAPSTTVPQTFVHGVVATSSGPVPDVCLLGNDQVDRIGNAPHFVAGPTGPDGVFGPDPAWGEGLIAEIEVWTCPDGQLEDQLPVRFFVGGTIVAGEDHEIQVVLGDGTCGDGAGPLVDILGPLDSGDCAGTELGSL